MKPAQQSFRFRTWGGARKGAGRPKAERTRVPHRSRPALASRFPVHVTLRVRAGCWNLRGSRSYAALRAAFGAGCERFGFRLTHYSVQGNHVHLMAEASEAVALSRGLKGLSVRIAKKLNRLMRRRGPVLGDRYHAHILRRPAEVGNALRYVVHNARSHAARRGRPLSRNWVDPCSSWFLRMDPTGEPQAPAVAEPRTWLMRVGWRRSGLLGFV